jgi:hypothetical protein
MVRSRSAEIVLDGRTSRKDSDAIVAGRERSAMLEEDA